LKSRQFRGADLPGVLGLLAPSVHTPSRLDHLTRFFMADVIGAAFAESESDPCPHRDEPPARNTRPTYSVAVAEVGGCAGPGGGGT
jgi:hypothetical protein